MEMKWRPIETAPLWKLVIIYDPFAPKRKSSHKVNVAVQTSFGKWDLANNYKPKEPKYWMPLPDAPHE